MELSLQDLFRTVNDRLRERMVQLEVTGRSPLICECRDGDCLQVIEVTAEEYSAVRSFPDRYIVATGHARLELERIIESGDGFDVVEKTAASEPPGS